MRELHGTPAVLTFAALLLLSAQEPPRLDETIVVTAERLEQRLEESTAAVTVLRAEELQRLPAATLGDVLQLVPGLQLLSVNPGAPPMIASRGFFGAGEVEYLQLRIDGVIVGDAESGLADWRSVPLASIDRIEILRGAGSSLFGDTALGGVVQVFRRDTSDASISAESFGTVALSGHDLFLRNSTVYALRDFHDMPTVFTMLIRQLKGAGNR